MLTGRPPLAGGRRRAEFGQMAASHISRYGRSLPGRSADFLPSRQSGLGRRFFSLCVTGYPVCVRLLLKYLLPPLLCQPSPAYSSPLSRLFTQKFIALVSLYLER